MVYKAIDTFYLTDEQLKNSPSRKDGIDGATETTLRMYGCDLIQESAILLELPHAVMATGQVLFHRFYCKESFARFNVKRVAASCVWLASKGEEIPRRAIHVLNVFHRMECRRENLPFEHLDSKKCEEFKMELFIMEMHVLKENCFICRVELPHKFILNYLNILGAPPKLRQEAWNLANDSLRTRLCVRFESTVVASGVVFAAARRFQIPLPENPPWWEAFDADKSKIDEVCSVLAEVYSLPKAQYIPVCKEGSFTTPNRSWDSPYQPVPKEILLGGPPTNNLDVNRSKDGLIKAALDKLKVSKKKSDDYPQTMLIEEEAREKPMSKLKSEHRTEVSEERIKKRGREKEKERLKVRDRERGRFRPRTRTGGLQRPRTGATVSRIRLTRDQMNKFIWHCTRVFRSGVKLTRDQMNKFIWHCTRVFRSGVKLTRDQMNKFIWHCTRVFRSGVKLTRDQMNKFIWHCTRVFRSGVKLTRDQMNKFIWHCTRVFRSGVKGYMCQRQRFG